MSGSRDKRDRVPDLVRAIAQSERGELSSGELGRALDLKSTRSVSGWITKAGEAGLIEATTESPFAPNRAYRLTRNSERRFVRTRTAHRVV